MKSSMKILITKRSQINKFKYFVLSIQHFKNMLYKIALKYDSNDKYIPKWLLDYNTLYKIIRRDEYYPDDIDDEIKKIIHDLKQVSKNVLGSGYTRSTIREVVREFKGVIGSRCKGLYTNFPKPRKLDKTFNVTISLNKDCYTNKTKNKNKNVKNEYVVRLGLTGKYLKFKIPRNINFSTDFKITWIDNTCLIINLTYEKEIDVVNLDPTSWLSIDIGENNLMACVSNHKYLKSFLIDGKPLKSIIHRFSKLISELQSEGKKILVKKMYFKMNRIIDNYLNIASNFIKEIVTSNKIGNVFIGDISSIFQGNSGYKKHNFVFRKFPLGKLIRKLKYKLEPIGCNVIKTPEHYTSKKSCITDSIGNRKSGIINVDNKSYHADINAAYNIAKRNLDKNAFFNAISSVKLCNPVKLKLFSVYNWRELIQKTVSSSPLIDDSRLCVDDMRGGYNISPPGLH